MNYKGAQINGPKDKKVGKLMTMHKALHLRDDVDRLYVSRKESGKWLSRIEDCVDASTLEDYIKKSKKRLITTVSNSDGILRTDRTTAKTKK